MKENKKIKQLLEDTINSFLSKTISSDDLSSRVDVKALKLKIYHFDEPYTNINFYKTARFSIIKEDFNLSEKQIDSLRMVIESSVFASDYLKYLEDKEKKTKGKTVILEEGLRSLVLKDL